jgi:hypothetical protein
MHLVAEAAKRRLNERGLSYDVLYEDEFRAILRREVGWQSDWARAQGGSILIEPLQIIAAEAAVDLYARKYNHLAV